MAETTVGIEQRIDDLLEPLLRLVPIDEMQARSRIGPGGAYGEGVGLKFLPEALVRVYGSVAKDHIVDWQDSAKSILSVAGKTALMVSEHAERGSETSYFLKLAPVLDDADSRISAYYTRGSAHEAEHNIPSSIGSKLTFPTRFIFTAPIRAVDLSIDPSGIQTTSASLNPSLVTNEAVAKFLIDGKVIAPPNSFEDFIDDLDSRDTINGIGVSSETRINRKFPAVSLNSPELADRIAVNPEISYALFGIMRAMKERVTSRRPKSKGSRNLEVRQRHDALPVQSLDVLRLLSRDYSELPYLSGRVSVETAQDMIGATKTLVHQVQNGDRFKN